MLCEVYGEQDFVKVLDFESPKRSAIRTILGGSPKPGCC